MLLKLTTQSIYTYSFFQTMSTVKIKFRPSVVADKEGAIYYQVTHHRQVRRIRTEYRIFPNEWDEMMSQIRFRENNTSERQSQLRFLQKCIDCDRRRIRDIVATLENQSGYFTADDIVAEFALPDKRQTMSTFMNDIVVRLTQMGKLRTAEIYDTVMRSFNAFRDGKETLPDEVDADMIQLYEAYLLGKGIVRNTTSFYMRTLRAVYNRTVEKGLTVQRDPFRHVYTGIDKTVKRAISLDAIRRIRDLDLSKMPACDFARDIFLFSFYTRGMSFVDMAYLKCKDLRDGVLSYSRHKTRQRLYIKWEQCMQAIVDKYSPMDSTYLFPIIKKTGNAEDERRQYRNGLRLVNKNLKKVSVMVGLDVKLTMYVSRHTWASVAHQRNIPLAVISEGMGHDSETTTRIYLTSLDSSAVDRANEAIINSI